MPTDAELELAAKQAVSTTPSGEALPEGYYSGPASEPLDRGEYGEPIPETQPQETSDLAKIAHDAYYQAQPHNLLQQSFGRMWQFDETVLKRLGVDITGGTAGLAQQAAAIANLTQAPNLEGLSVDQVRLIRDQMVKQKADVDEQLSRLMDTGIPDDQGIRTLAVQASSFDERIKQADGIIASGQAAFQPSPTTSPVGGFLRSFGERAVPAVQTALDKLFPTDQDFVNSLPGQIATGGADAIYLAGTQAIGLGLPAAVGLFGSQTYQDAKGRGASDEVAERASLMTGLITAPTMVGLGSIVGGLAQSFAGLSAKEGIQRIIQAGTHIVGTGGEMSAFQLEQNAIAKLSGYDPDRKLDEGTWQAFWTGIGWGSISQMLSRSPRLARLNQPDVTVRNKPGTPPDTGPQTPTQPQAAQQPSTAAETALSPVVEPLEAAQAAVAQTTGATSEQVLASVGTPEEAFLETVRTLGAETPQTLAPPAAPAVPRAVEAPVTTEISPAPITAPEVVQPKPATAPEPVQKQEPPVALPSIAHQNAYDELVRRGVPRDEAYDRISRSQSDNYAGILKDAAQVASPTWYEREGEAAAQAALRAKSPHVYARDPTGREDVAMIVGDINGTFKVAMPRQGMGISGDQSFATREEAQTAARNAFRKSGWTVPEPPVVPSPIRLARQPRPEPGGIILRVDAQGNVIKGEPEPVQPPNPAVTQEDIARRAYLPSRTGVEPVEIQETPVTRADVKREVNQAQRDMGMEDHLHYVSNVESLPDHVKNGLTVGERNSTAQIIRDNKLGDFYVIGDRFTGLQELRRAIIEETQPYLYRNVTDLKVTHDPTNRDLGRYDPISDSPSINTHAILRSANPYLEASRTAMEEVNVHQGISRLLRPRDAGVYVDAMNSVQRNFDRLKLNDILAQKKGYKNLDEMAKDYGVSDYKTNPRSQHKLTEELIGAYSRTFDNPTKLQANSPPWYQQALRNLNNAIRGGLGLKLQDYDVQSLLADSASALRRPKYDQPGQFHPETDAKAKADMAQFQMANRRPEEGAPAGAEEKAQIGEALVQAKAKELAAGLRPGEIIRQQPLRLAMQQARSFRERMNLLNRTTIIDSYEGHKEVMQAASDMYQRDLGNDPNRAMNDILEWRRTGAVNPALVEVANRETTNSINNLKARGFGDQAALLEAKLDRFNMETASRVTEVARELAAQRLRHLDGQTASTGYRQAVQEMQEREFSKRSNRSSKAAADKGLDQVKEVTKKAANTLREKTKKEIKSLADRIAATAKRLSERKPPEPREEARPRPTTKSVPEQYTEHLVKRIDDALNKVGRPGERAPLEEVYDTFRKNIQEQVKEQVETPERPKPPRPSPTDTLRQVILNYPYYQEAWRRTVDQLQTTNPELYKALDRALAEPVGEHLADRLAMEHGQDLNDLIYNHFSTVDRVTDDLAQRIASATGLSGAQSKRLTGSLQDLFKDIVEKNQKSKLDQILKAVGGTRNPAKGELDRLVDHIVLGSLDNAEWLNHVAPRFGLESYMPPQIANLKLAGDKMAKMRDDGLSNSAIAQKVRRDISDLTKINEDPDVVKAFRYINDVYASSLLTGPLTHAPYWQQGLMQGMWDNFVHGIRTSVKTGDPTILAQMIAKAFHGYGRGMGEFGPILREGFKPPEEFMEEAGGKKLYSSPMERTQFSWQNPRTWFSRYKYVRNFLDAVSNLMLRGPEYATHHAVAMSMTWDDGLRGKDAWEAATKVVLGSEAKQQMAKTDARNFASKYGLNEDQTRMLENELLDQYKATSDLPAGAQADEQTENLQDLARRAYDTGLSGTLRGDVRGMWGRVSRGLLSFANKHPFFRPIAEFLKIPFNAVNEFLAWTPIGFWRSVPDLVPAPLADFSRNWLVMGGAEGYLKDSWKLYPFQSQQPEPANQVYLPRATKLRAAGN